MAESANRMLMFLAYADALKKSCGMPGFFLKGEITRPKGTGPGGLKASGGPARRWDQPSLLAKLPNSNIGKNMAMTMEPTTRPMNTMMSGSIIEVSPLTAASTSWS